MCDHEGSTSGEEASEPDDAYQRARRATRHPNKHNVDKRMVKSQKATKGKCDKGRNYQAKKGKAIDRSHDVNQDTAGTEKFRTLPSLMSIALPVSSMPRIPRLPTSEDEICPHCAQVFRHRQSLNRHVRTAHSGRRWQCPPCQKEFCRRDSFLRHQEKTGHGGMNIYMEGQPIRSPSASREVFKDASSNPEMPARSMSFDSYCSSYHKSSGNWNSRRDQSETKVLSSPKAAKGRPSPLVAKEKPSRVIAKPTSTRSRATKVMEPLTVTLDRSPKSTDLLRPDLEIHLSPVKTPVHSRKEDGPDRKSVV